MLTNNPACGLWPTKSDIRNAWCHDYANVLELADYLVNDNELTSAHLVLAYFKDPKRYTAEWEAYQRSTNVMEETEDAVRSLPLTERLSPLPR